MFRLRALNTHGWGPYSNEITVIPSSAPSKMAVVTTVTENVYVKISWAQPNDNGAAITANKIVILEVDGLTWTESASCNGADATTFSDEYCLMPMSELTDPSAYGLPINRPVYAKVQAFNLKGWSDLSDINTVAALAEVVPGKVATPTRGAQTTES